jgi:hypothetical protein
MIGNSGCLFLKKLYEKQRSKVKIRVFRVKRFFEKNQLKIPANLSAAEAGRPFI